MFFKNDVRDFEQIPKGEGARLPEGMDLGPGLIEKMPAAEFEPEGYHDEYRERFLAIVGRKVKGQEITVAPPAPEPAQRSLGFLPH